MRLAPQRRIGNLWERLLVDLPSKEPFLGYPRLSVGLPNSILVKKIFCSLLRSGRPTSKYPIGNMTWDLHHKACIKFYEVAYWWKFVGFPRAFFRLPEAQNSILWYWDIQWSTSASYTEAKVEKVLLKKKACWLPEISSTLVLRKW